MDALYFAIFVSIRTTMLDEPSTFLFFFGWNIFYTLRCLLCQSFQRWFLPQLNGPLFVFLVFHPLIFILMVWIEYHGNIKNSFLCSRARPSLKCFVLGHFCCCTFSKTIFFHISRQTHHFWSPSYFVFPLLLFFWHQKKFSPQNNHMRIVQLFSLHHSRVDRNQHPVNVQHLTPKSRL